MKLLGAAMILTASFCAGIIHSLTKRQRIDNLQEICSALALMEGELGARLTPMPELIRLLAGRAPGQTGAFFSVLSASMDRLGEEDFASLWQMAVRQTMRSMEEAEREELCRLGLILGQYELEKQLAAIRTCMVVLRGGLETAQNKYLTEKKLSLGLPAAAGALLIIVLF